MKNNIEQIIQEKCNELKLDGSKQGLRLEWVNEQNYSVYYKGVKYTPDDFSDYKTFLDNVLAGKETDNEERMRKLIIKQKKELLKEEEKYDGQKNEKRDGENDEGKKEKNDDEGKGEGKNDEGKKEKNDDDIDTEILLSEEEIVGTEPIIEKPAIRGRGRPPKNR